VEEIYGEVARVFGPQRPGDVFIHSGSRGLGYQVCDDFLKKMGERVRRLGLELPDRQLACDYVQSQTGQDYLSAMAAAANYAWANRQMLMHWTREVFENVLQMSPRDLGMRLLYDVCHNIAKRETHTIGGERREVCVHRKGATAPSARGITASRKSIGRQVNRS
jgi:tRNA-splicing ligase RtcB